MNPTLTLSSRLHLRGVHIYRNNHKIKEKIINAKRGTEGRRIRKEH